MGWQDRGYNAGRDNFNAYLSSPASFLQYSMPLYRSASLTIRLHFWFLLYAVFLAIGLMREHAPLYYIPLDIAILLAAVLVHEVGHRVFARSVGGNHWEWMLWPLGGMVAPTCPRNPKAVFIANVGGIAVSLPLAVLAYIGLRLIPNMGVGLHFILDPFNPLMVLTAHPDPAVALAGHCLATFCSFCAAITVINLFPCFWFDGGHIWYAILWPKLGQYRAMSITNMAGMILAVPIFLLALWQTDFFSLIVWALIFADCFNRRRELAAAGPGMIEEDEISYNYMDTPPPASRKKKLKTRSVNAARKQAKAEQQEQAQIDAILVKVKEYGLHSLNWREKRTLKKATERQRARDLARRR